MDIQIMEHVKEALQVVIKCRQMDEEVIRLKNHIELFDKRLQTKRGSECLYLLPAFYPASDSKMEFYGKADLLYAVHQSL